MAGNVRFYLDDGLTVEADVGDLGQTGGCTCSGGAGEVGDVGSIDLDKVKKNLVIAQLGPSAEGFVTAVRTIARELVYKISTAMGMAFDAGTATPVVLPSVKPEDKARLDTVAAYFGASVLTRGRSNEAAMLGNLVVNCLYLVDIGPDLDVATARDLGRVFRAH